MALTITEPSQVVNGMLTKIIAVRSQLLYPMARADYNVIGGIDDGGQVAIRLDPSFGDLTSLFVAGNIIFLGQETLFNYEERTYTVVSSAFTTDTAITIDTPFAGGSLGYVNDLTNRTAYHINIDIFSKAGVKQTTSPLKFVPPQSGLINIDLSGPLTALTSLNGPFSFEYFLEVTEVFTGSSESTVQTITQQAIFGKEQLLHLGGALMQDNLLRRGASATDSTEGEILTVFENPLMWRDWNRTAAFIMDADFQIRNGGLGDARFSYFGADINKVPTGSVTNGPTITFADPQIQLRPVFFFVGEEFTRITIRDSALTLVWTKEIFYQALDECPNPIMLDWINSLGGIEQWLFSISQTVITESGEGVVIEIPITQDIANITRTKQRFPGPTVQRMTLMAEHLTRDQLRALQEIKETESLRVYLSKDGVNFIDAIVVTDFSTTYQTKDILHSYTIVIEFPDDFDFFTAKLY